MDSLTFFIVTIGHSLAETFPEYNLSILGHPSPDITAYNAKYIQRIFIVTLFFIGIICEYYNINPALSGSIGILVYIMLVTTLNHHINITRILYGVSVILAFMHYYNYKIYHNIKSLLAGYIMYYIYSMSLSSNNSEIYYHKDSKYMAILLHMLLITKLLDMDYQFKHKFKTFCLIMPHIILIIYNYIKLKKLY